MLADGMAAVAAISDNPQKHVRQAREQWRSLGNLRGRLPAGRPGRSTMNCLSIPIARLEHR
jgi:hypothetical protein